MGDSGPSAQRPHVIPGPPPPLISFVCSSVREQSARDPGLQGVDLYPSPPNPAPPLPIAPTIHMQATHHPPILSSHLSTPGQAVVSRLKFKSSDRPGREGPRQTRPGRRRGPGEGGGAVFGCSFFSRGQIEMVRRRFGDGLGSHAGVSSTPLVTESGSTSGNVDV